MLTLTDARGEHLVSKQEQNMIGTMLLSTVKEEYEADKVSLYNISQKLSKFIEVINSLPTLKINFVNIIDINKLDENDNTLLKDAILRQDSKIVKSLLSWPGIDINKSTAIPTIRGVKEEDQPFLLAVGMGNVEIVQAFLAHPQTNIRQQTQDHETALIVAAQINNVEVLKLLIDHLVAYLQDICENDLEQLREYINFQDRHNHTALYYAVDNYLSLNKDSTEIIQTLLLLQDNRGELLVSKQEQNMIGTMLLSTVKEEYEADKVSLYNISQKLSKFIEVINSLPTLKINFVNIIDINKLDENDNTLLKDAILRQDSKIVKSLLSWPGIDINKSTAIPTIRGVKEEDQPFLLAVGMGNVEIVQAFLAHPQTNIRQQTQDHETALIVAAQINNVEVLKLLIDHLVAYLQDICENDLEQLREYINFQDRHNHTALYYAVDNYLSLNKDSTEIIQTLLLLQDNRGELLVSKQEQNMIGTMLLSTVKEEYEADKVSLYNISQKLSKFIEVINSLPTLKINFVNIIDINKLDENGNTLLKDAILRRDSNTVKFLLECPEININKSIPIPTIRGPNNDESFLLAVGMGNVKIVQAFLAHPQINIKQQNQDLETALIIAAQACKVEVLQLLVSYFITNWQDIFENALGRVIN